LLIQRSEGNVVDLAGTVGAEVSAYKDKDGEILLQSAVFEPAAVRRNATEVLATDASYRFQRGVDRALAEMALKRFVGLLSKFVPDIKVAGYQVYESDYEPQKIEISSERVGRLLGTDISRSNISDLKRLGFVVGETDVLPPSWRYDIRLEADVAEEIGRITGLNRLKPRQITPKPKKPFDDPYHRLLSFKRQLCALGFTEIMSYSFAKQGKVRLHNPRTTEEAFLRQSLMPGLLGALSRNPYLKKSLFFEVGNVFLPEETTAVGLIVSGWKENAVNELGEKLSQAFGCEVKFQAIDHELLLKSDVKQPKVWFTEAPLSTLGLPMAEPSDISLGKFRAVSKFPPAVRDVTVVVNAAQDEEMVCQILNDSPQLLFAELIDSFRSAEALGADRKALTYRFYFQNLNRSLTDTEADRLTNQATERLADKVKFELR
jgi:phenylalanyl-tRNA synthetase beta chain